MNSDNNDDKINHENENNNNNNGNDQTIPFAVFQFQNEISMKIQPSITKYRSSSFPFKILKRFFFSLHFNINIIIYYFIFNFVNNI